MDIEAIKKILGLPPEATEDQVLTAIKAGAQAVEDIAAERAKAEAAGTDAANACTERDEARTELENCKRELADAKTALANEKAQHEKTKALKTAPASPRMAISNEAAAHTGMFRNLTRKRKTDAGSPHATNNGINSHTGSPTLARARHAFLAMQVYLILL